MAILEPRLWPTHVEISRIFFFCRQLRPSSATRPSDEVIPLGYPLQNWHFLNLGRQIWNQDCDKILNFFEKSFLPKQRLDPKAQPFLLWDQYLIPKKNFFNNEKIIRIFVIFENLKLTPKPHFSGMKSSQVFSGLFFTPKNPSNPDLTIILAGQERKNDKITKSKT